MIHNKFRYILTLVALFAMTAGAWAEEVTVTFTQADLNGYSTVAKDGVTLTPGNDQVHNYANLYNYGSTTFSVDKGKFTKIEIVNCTYVFPDISGWQKEQTGSYELDPEMDPEPLYTLTWTGEAESVAFTANVYGIQSIVFTIDKPDVDVTINDTKTEASFEMQTFDMDVDYELVRDMSVQMQAQVGDDATKEPRYRVQWNGENWVPAELTSDQVMALFSVNDLVENTTLDPKNYFVSIYAVNEQGETTGDPMTFLNFTFAPGRYCVTASAMLGSPTYEGTTALSNIFELFQGYEVEIAAQSFATYYKDEALTIDESTAEDAALYTISEVTATEAVLSNEIEAAPKSTPLLVFNSSDKARTILLIPTNEPNLALTVAPEFKGTATAKTFSEADMEAANFYVLTDANAFVWVKGAGQIAANKCWLEIPKTAPNNTRAIVFGEDATAIKSIANGQEPTANSYYDLSGRKVADGQQPKTKGLYINGGRKVVIK